VLLDETLDPGLHVVVWDGRNLHGRAVFCGFEAAGFTETRQLLVLR
jgi:hypothetical protein